MKALGIISLLLVLVIAVHDLAASPREAFGARAAVFAIDQYRAVVSPRIRGRVHCRFQPSCSAYGRAVIEKYGLARGSFKAALRLARCGPWTPAGTVDKP